MKSIAARSLAIGVYERIKTDIFDFVLLPGDRFSESEIAARLGVSRTPVREALYRLEREGYIEVSARSGWSVKPFDFAAFENLYDVRVILEIAAVRRLCSMERFDALAALRATWCAPAERRPRDPALVCAMDEAFHNDLVAATGNDEMAHIHRDVSERIRIIRRLDFTRDDRIDYTFEEHARILKTVEARRVDKAVMQLTSHIEASKAVVRQITLHRLHTARAATGVLAPERRYA